MKKKLEEHKSQRENFINVEKGLLDEIGKLKTFNASLNEKVGSLQSQTGAEDASVLREELNAQKKKVLDMDVENKKIARRFFNIKGMQYFMSCEFILHFFTFQEHCMK